jgi:hypothetical protein
MNGWLLGLADKLATVKIQVFLISTSRWSNRVLISFSLSPIHFDTKVLALILKKVDLHSVATAFASMVLPFPGGP